jgi:hypothetical protein
MFLREYSNDLDHPGSFEALLIVLLIRSRVVPKPQTSFGFSSIPVVIAFAAIRTTVTESSDVVTITASDHCDLWNFFATAAYFRCARCHSCVNLRFHTYFSSHHLFLFIRPPQRHLSHAVTNIIPIPTDTATDVSSMSFPTSITIFI